MECKFLKLGDKSPCTFKPTKNSNYCFLHNYLIKNSKAKHCLICNKGTKSSVQICMKCRGNTVRQKKYYYRQKPFKEEAKRLRFIQIDQFN